ncbi:MAG: exosortase/archaeosortase family protein [Fidelibacterota bacterium]
MTGKENKSIPSTLFTVLIKAGIIYTIWHLLYDYFLLPDGRLDTFLSLWGIRLAAGTLSILGWEVETAGRVIAVFGTKGVEIQNGCNGLDLLGLYSGFIVAFPGPMHKRLLLLFGGLGILFTANVFRIGIFALTNVYFPDHWEKVHTYSSYVIFYPLVLALWYLWTIISDQQILLSGKKFSSV